VRRDEMRDQPRVVRAAMGTDHKAIKGFWGMRKDHSDRRVDQINTMYRLQRSKLKSARAWRLNEALRSTYPTGVTSNCPEKAEAALKSWMSWARRSRLKPFKKLATTLKDRPAGVVRRMLDGRSNAYVDSMNRMLLQIKRAARGFRTVKNFVAIAYLRMSKLKNLPQNPLRPAAPLRSTIVHFGKRQSPHRQGGSLSSIGSAAIAPAQRGKTHALIRNLL
jgi:transposase